MPGQCPKCRRIETRRAALASIGVDASEDPTQPLPTRQRSRSDGASLMLGESAAGGPISQVPVSPVDMSSPKRLTTRATAATPPSAKRSLARRQIWASSVAKHYGTKVAADDGPSRNRSRTTDAPGSRAGEPQPQHQHQHQHQHQNPRSHQQARAAPPVRAASVRLPARTATPPRRRSTPNLRPQAEAGGSGEVPSRAAPVLGAARSADKSGEDAPRRGPTFSGVRTGDATGPHSRSGLPGPRVVSSAAASRGSRGRPTTTAAHTRSLTVGATVGSPPRWGERPAVRSSRPAATAPRSSTARLPRASSQRDSLGRSGGAHSLRSTGARGTVVRAPTMSEFWQADFVSNSAGGDTSAAALDFNVAPPAVDGEHSE